MAKGKKKNSTASNGQIKDLTARVDKLGKLLKQEKKGKQKNAGGDKAAKKKSGKTKTTKRIVLGAFPRGILDPFSVRGTRVPDGAYIRTATSYVRYYTSAAPSYNFTTNTPYVSLMACPIYSSAALPLSVACAAAAANSWFDQSANASGNVTDYTKNFARAGTGGGVNFEQGNPTGGYANYRVTGGGLRVKFYGIPPMTPIDVYALPMFNGDGRIARYQELTGQKTRHWRIKGDSVITLPWAIRDLWNAFNWTDGVKVGTAASDYPAQDNITAAMLPSAFATASSTDNTNTNVSIEAWSLQTGMGGWQLVFNLPPGAGWLSESISHLEVEMPRSTANAYETEANTRPEYCNTRQMEVCCNLAASTCQDDTTQTQGNDSPWEDVRRKLGNKTIEAIGKILEDQVETFLYGPQAPQVRYYG